MTSKRLAVGGCVALFLASICAVSVLAGGAFLLNVVSEKVDTVNAWAAQGGTCATTATIPLAMPGLALLVWKRVWHP